MRISGLTAFGLIANLICLGLALRWQVYIAMLLGLIGLGISGILLILEQRRDK